MAIFATHYRIKEGKREEYLEAHESVPEELEKAYEDAGVGLRRAITFEDEGHVFAYVEVEKPEKYLEFLQESSVVESWNSQMEEYLHEEDLDDPFMEEIHRI